MSGGGGVLSFFREGGGGAAFFLGEGTGGLLLPVFCIHNFGEMACKPWRKSL